MKLLVVMLLSSLCATAQLTKCGTEGAQIGYEGEPYICNQGRWQKVVCHEGERVVSPYVYWLNGAWQPSGVPVSPNIDYNTDRQFLCVNGRWQEDKEVETRNSELAKQKEERRDFLYKALISGVLTDSEFTEVLELGPDVLPEQAINYIGTPDSYNIKYKRYLDVLYQQARLRALASSSSNCVVPLDGEVATPPYYGWDEKMNTEPECLHFEGHEICLDSDGKMFKFMPEMRR